MAETSDIRWFHSFEAGDGSALRLGRDAKGDLFACRGPNSYLFAPAGFWTSAAIYDEVERLASPEAAWETVEALWLGIQRIGWERFAELYQDPDINAHPSDLHAVFTQHPLGLLMRAGEAGKPLFAECLRLGREGRT